MVWSIDAIVPLFELKFTVLFIVCLVLFVTLLIFNITSLFTRCVLKFKYINCFKSIMNACQESYKDRYFYWFAVSSILISLLFAFYVFQENMRMLFATIVLIVLTCTFATIYPNKNVTINFQELLLLINLTLLHAVSYYSDKDPSYVVTNLMISLAFFHFCIILLYHSLTYTCNCNTERIMEVVKKFRHWHLCTCNNEFSLKIVAT